MSSCHNPEVAGEQPVSLESRVLETGAAMTQDFAPVKNICAHLNAFHAYADDPKRFVEANHYCAHVTDGMHLPLTNYLPSPTDTPWLTVTYDTQTYDNASSTTAPAPTPASSASST
jgi:hypothetical protein